MIEQLFGRADIGVSGFQPSGEEKINKQVEIRCDRRTIDTERAGKLSGIQQAGLVMGQHHSETPQRFRRDPRAELRDIALKIGADEILPPAQPETIIRRQETLGKSAAQPKDSSWLQARQARGPDVFQDRQCGLPVSRRTAS